MDKARGLVKIGEPRKFTKWSSPSFRKKVLYSRFAVRPISVLYRPLLFSVTPSYIFEDVRRLLTIDKKRTCVEVSSTPLLINRIKRFVCSSASLSIFIFIEDARSLSLSLSLFPPIVKILRSCGKDTDVKFTTGLNRRF